MGTPMHRASCRWRHCDTAPVLNVDPLKGNFALRESGLWSVDLTSVNALLNVQVVVVEVPPLECEDLAWSKARNCGKDANQVFPQIQD